MGGGAGESRPAPGFTLAEEDLRLLQAERDGVPHERKVEFLGEWYDVKGTGLVSLLRYAGQRNDPTGQIAMAQAHRIMEESIADFRAFQEAAITGKAKPDDVTSVLQQIVEIYTARPWRAALRLLGYAAMNLAELEGGQLAKTGLGFESLTPRQLCNLVFSSLISQYEDEERRAEFVEDLYLDFDPEDEARKQVEAMIASKET